MRATNNKNESMSKNRPSSDSLLGANANRQREKKLFASTDFWGNIFRYQGFMNKSQLNDLNKELALLGVTRHQWLVDTTETYYDNYPLGFDLLEEAVKSAHAHG